MQKKTNEIDQYIEEKSKQRIFFDEQAIGTFSDQISVHFGSNLI